MENNISTRVSVTAEPEKENKEALITPPPAPTKDRTIRAVPRSVATPAGASVANKTKGGFSVRLFDGLATVALVALFFGLPIFFTGLTLQGVDFERHIYFYFWLLIGLVAWVARGIVLGEMKIRRTPLDLFLWFFVAAYGISCLLSIDRWHSFWGSFGDPSRGFLSVFALVLAYYFILSHFTPRRFMLMLGALMVSGWLVVLWMFLLTIGAHFMPAAWETMVPLTPFGTVSAALLFCGAFLPLLVTVIVKVYTSGLSKALKIPLIGLLLAGLLMGLFVLLAGYTYVTWWALLVGFAVYLVYVLAQIVRLPAQWTWLPMAILVALLAFSMIGANELARVDFPVEATPNVRLSWEIAKQGLNDKLFFGSGPGSYAYTFSRYYPTDYNLQSLFSLRFSQGAGVFFEALPTLGVVGGFLLAILVLSLLSVGFYLLSYGREYDKVASLGLWTSLVILLFNALVMPFGASILILSILVAALSLAALLWETHSPETYFQLSLKSSPQFALALAFVFIVVSAGVAFTFVFIGKAFWADTLAARGLRAQSFSAESVDAMNRALRYMPNEGRYYSGLGQIYMALANQEAAKPEQERNIEALKAQLQAAGQAVNTAKDKMPNDASIQQLIAQVYENISVLSGNNEKILEQTQKEYERAAELEPNNPVLYLKLGRIKQSLAANQKGDDQKVTLEASKSLFQTAIDRKSDFVAAYVGLSLTQEALGDKNGAIETLEKYRDEKAKGVEKNNPDVKYTLARLYRLRDQGDDLTRAEALLEDLATSNDRDINIQLNLGLIYEKTGRKDEAIKSYQRIIDVLQGDQFDTTRKQVEKLIENVRNGKSNNDANTVPDNTISDPVASQSIEPAPAQ